MSENTEIAVIDTLTEGSSIRTSVQRLADGGRPAVFSTIKADTFEDKIRVVDAMSNSKPLADNLNKVIALRDVIIQVVPMADEKTGEILDQPRIILVDADGNGYHAISGGLYRSIENILGVIGHPNTWNAPVPLTVSREGSGVNKYFTARIAKAGK